MDDFMEKLLKDVSRDTNNMGNMGNTQDPYIPKQPGGGYPADNMTNYDQQAVNSFRQPAGNMSVSPFQSTQPLPNMQQYGMPRQNMQGTPQPIHIQQMQQTPSQMQQSTPQTPPQMQMQQPTPQTPPQMQAQQAVPPQMQQPNMRQTVIPEHGAAYVKRPGNGAVAFEDVYHT